MSRTNFSLLLYKSEVRIGWYDWKGYTQNKFALLRLATGRLGKCFLKHPSPKFGEELYQQDAYNKLGDLPKHGYQPFRSRARPVKPRTAAGPDADNLIQQGGATIQGNNVEIPA